MKHQTNPQDLREAKQWFQSLPAGRRNYFKQSYRLGNDERLVRFWLNNIKPIEVNNGAH